MKILQKKSKLDNTSGDSGLDNDIKSFKLNKLKKVSSDMNQKTKKKGLIPTRSLLNISNKNNSDIGSVTSYDTTTQTSLDTSINSGFSFQSDFSKLIISKPIIQHSSYASTNLNPLSDLSFDKFDFQPPLTSTPKSNEPTKRPIPPPPPPLPPPSIKNQNSIAKDNSLDKYKIDLSEYSNVNKKHLKALKTSEKSIKKEKENDVTYPTISKLALHPNLTKNTNQTVQSIDLNKVAQNKNNQKYAQKPTISAPKNGPPPPPPPPPLPQSLNLISTVQPNTTRLNKTMQSKPPLPSNDKSALLDQIRSFKGFNEHDKVQLGKTNGSLLVNKSSVSTSKPKEMNNKDVLNDEIKKFANRGFSDKAKQNLKNAEQKIVNNKMQNNVTESLNESIEKILSSRRAYLGKF